MFVIRSPRPRKPAAPSRYAPDPRPHPQAAYAERERARRMARNVVSPPPEVVAALKLGNAAPKCVQCMQHVYAPGHVCTVVDARGEALFRVPAPEPSEARVRVGDVWCRGRSPGRTVSAIESGGRVQFVDGEWSSTLTDYLAGRIATAHPWTLLSRAPAQPARGWRDATTVEQACALAGLTDGGSGNRIFWRDGKRGATQCVWLAYDGWRGRRATDADTTRGQPFGTDWRRAIAHALGEQP